MSRETTEETTEEKQIESLKIYLNAYILVT